MGSALAAAVLVAVANGLAAVWFRRGYRLEREERLAAEARARNAEQRRVEVTRQAFYVGPAGRA